MRSALLCFIEVPFKPGAYEKAAYAVEALDTPLTEIHRRGGIQAVEEIPGVGRNIGVFHPGCFAPRE